MLHIQHVLYICLYIHFSMHTVPKPQFEEMIYRVPENDRTVPLCVDIDVNITEAVMFTITAEQKYPAEAEGKCLRLTNS